MLGDNVRFDVDYDLLLSNFIDVFLYLGKIQNVKFLVSRLKV